MNNLTLDKLKKLADEKDELRLKEEIVDSKKVIIASYMVQFEDTFNNPLAREFRGTVFDAETGECICRPFPKFFNVNERPETKLENINLDKCEFYTKHDGSLLMPVLINDKIFWKTIKSFYSDVAIKASKFIETLSHKNKLYYMIKNNPNKTFLFEYVSPSNKIVLQYDNDQLLYLGSRNINTGIIDLSSLNKKQYINFNEIDNMEGIEGFVLFDREKNELYKKKTKWYLDRHHLLTDLSDKELVNLILDDKIDDVLADIFSNNDIDEQLLNRISIVKDKIYREKLRIELLVTNFFNQIYNNDRKIFANEVNDKIDVKYRKYLFYLYDDKDINELIIKDLKNNYRNILK